jgi:hypothetical protein
LPRKNSNHSVKLGYFAHARLLLEGKSENQKRGKVVGKKPKFNIPVRVVDQVDRCVKGKACLENPDHPLCDAKPSQANPRFTEISCESLDHICDYRILSNGKYLCTCPVRAYIFKKYKI